MAGNTLNEAQALCAKVYGDGDFAYVTDLDQCKEVADGLFTYLMVELSAGEGCSTLEDAVSRLEKSVQTIQEIAQAVWKLPPEEAEWFGGHLQGKPNGAQIAMLKTYADGHFAHITTTTEAASELDGLPLFFMSELSYESDCTAAEEALRRLDMMQREAQEVLDDVYQVSLEKDAAPALG